MPVLKFNQCDYNCDGKKDKRGSFRVYCKRVDPKCARELKAEAKHSPYVKSTLLEKPSKIAQIETLYKEEYEPYTARNVEVVPFMIDARGYRIPIIRAGKGDLALHHELIFDGIPHAEDIFEGYNCSGAKTYKIFREEKYGKPIVRMEMYGITGHDYSEAIVACLHHRTTLNVVNLRR